MVMGRGELPQTLRWRADWVMRLALQGGEAVAWPAGEAKIPDGEAHAT